MAELTTTISELNPKTGKVPLSNWVHLALLVFSLPVLLLQVTFRRVVDFGRTEISFKKDLALTLLRRSCTLPFPLIRLLSQPDPQKTLNSPRFCSQNNNLYQRVLRPDVAGYWLCKGAPGRPADPASCDIVIYYIHGGAYITGQPANFLNTALRTAEIAAERGISVSCFGVEYSLAPEAKFPRQVEQVVRGYEYLLHQNIDASKVAVLGDSVGGHLGLCLLASLQGAQLPKPGRGIFLQSPWIDLQCSRHASYDSNKYLDFLSREALIEGAKRLLDDNISKEAAEFVDFTRPPSGGRSWEEIMPTKVWVSAGSHEVLVGEIAEFSRCLKKDGVDAQIEVEEGGIHCWQGSKDIWDISKYLESTESSLPEGLLAGITNIADAILSGVERK